VTKTVTMSRKEQLRLEVLAQVKARRIRLRKAAQLLRVSYRQVLRINARYRKRGGAGLAHGLRGRPSNHRTDAKLKARVLQRYQAQYGDFGPTLAAEMLAQRDQITVDHETLRGWLLEKGLWKKRRKRQQHRSRREPKAHRGELLQLDGSPHAWLEGRGPRCSLVEAVDDATGETYGRLYPEETSEAVMDLLTRYLRRYGIPRALYVDKDSIYVVNNREPTAREILTGREPVTQVGRALQELAVELIVADSPQAKGRVERVHGTQQDRLVKLLRLEGIGTLEAANAYLEQQYWSLYNARFARPPRDQADLHRKAGKALKIEEILCFKETRTVSRDWCVVYGKRVFQLGPRHQSLALAGRKIQVLEKLDGTILLRHRGTNLAFWQRPPRPAAALGASPVPLQASAAPQPSVTPEKPPTPQSHSHVTVLSG
jgi:transposase